MNIDNKNLVDSLQKGRSNNSFTNELLIDSFDTLQKNHIEFQVAWVPTKEMKADGLSRLDLGSITPSNSLLLSEFGAARLTRKFGAFNTHVFCWPNENILQIDYASFHFSSEDNNNLNLSPLDYLMKTALRGSVLITPDSFHFDSVIQIIARFKNIRNLKLIVLLPANKAFEAFQAWHRFKPSLWKFAGPEDKSSKRSFNKSLKVIYYALCLK